MQKPINIANKKFAAHYIIYTSDFFLEDSIRSVIDFVDIILIAQTSRPWFGDDQDLSETNNLLNKLQIEFGRKIIIYKELFKDEQTQRNFLITKGKELGLDGMFIIDSDEIFIEDSFQNIYNFISENNPKALRIPYLTFVKDASFVVSEPYEDNLFYIDITNDVRFEWARKISVDETMMPYQNPEILHFSYLRENDEVILKKVKSFMHAKDTDWDKWYYNVYLKISLRTTNFHPVWPERWRGIEEFDSSKFPPTLFEKLLKYNRVFYSQKIKNLNKIKLHLGCGPKILDGYINIDLYNIQADLMLNITELSYFESNSVDEIFMNAVFEHLYTFEQIPALTEWFRILKKGGKIIINSTPDFDAVIKAYVDKTKGNCKEIFDLSEVSRYTHGEYLEENKLGQIHKDIFTKDKMKNLFEKVGFKIEKLESTCWENELNPVNIDVIATKNTITIDIEKNELDLIKAEKLIESEKFEEAKIILRTILKSDSLNTDAINNLAVIDILQKNYENAYELINTVLKINPQNEIALENIIYLSEIQKDYANEEDDERNNQNLKVFPQIEITKLDSFKTYQEYEQKSKNEYLERNDYEKSLLTSEEKFEVRGICHSCKKEVNFLVDYWNCYHENGLKIPNWRERLVCPECQLNNRMRLSLHLIEELKHDLSNSKVYIAEQTTQTYRKLQNICEELVGSEYIGNSIPFGTKNSDGIRNEDFTNLTFGKEEFDLVLSFDVFEHIYDYKKAFAEAFRVLKNGGSLLFTVPFDRNSELNITRANLKNDGSIEHLLAPEYHGDPMNSSEGCLCFFHFGWEMLNDLKEVGFDEAYSLFCYSKEYAYLGGDQVFFVANKNK